MTNKFNSCNDLWNSLSPEMKMWVHYYFWDIRDKKETFAPILEDMKDRHGFMKFDKGVDCGGVT